MAIQPTGAAPQVTALAPQQAMAPGPAQPGGDFEQLRQGWNAFFQRPETIAGLLQFGASMLTPGSGGIGPALSAGAQAAGRVVTARQGQQAAQAKMGLEREKLASRERTATAAEKGREARAQQAEKGRTQRARLAERGRQQRAQQAEEMQRRRLEEYLIPSLQKRKAGQGLSMQERLLTTVYDRWSTEAQNTALAGGLPEGADPNTWAMEQTLRELNSIGEIQKRLASGEAPAAEAGEPAEEEGPGLLSRAGSAIGGALGFGGEEQAQPAQAPGQAPTQVTESGLPPPDKVQDEQWLAIAQNPQWLQEATQAYGEAAVQQRIRIAQMRQRPASPAGAYQQGQTPWGQ